MTPTEIAALILAIYLVAVVVAEIIKWKADL